MDSERFRKQLQFILELDKEKEIFRQTSLTNHGRKENDSEHAWHMAIMAYLLKEYANGDIDIGKVMIMCLIHDVVEIDAGDTYAYDSEALKTQAEREKKAADRLFGMLPEDQGKELRSLFEEFEAYETMESKFAHVMDNFQPLLLNDSNGGSDWKEHNAKFEKIWQRQSKNVMGSEVIGKKTQEIVEKHKELGNI